MRLKKITEYNKYTDEQETTFIPPKCPGCHEPLDDIYQQHTHMTIYSGYYWSKKNAYWEMDSDASEGGEQHQTKRTRMTWHCSTCDHTISTKMVKQLDEEYLADLHGKLK